MIPAATWTKKRLFSVAQAQSRPINISVLNALSFLDASHFSPSILPPYHDDKLWTYSELDGSIQPEIPWQPEEL